MSDNEQWKKQAQFNDEMRAFKESTITRFDELQRQMDSILMMFKQEQQQHRSQIFDDSETDPAFGVAAINDIYVEADTDEVQQIDWVQHELEPPQIHESVDQGHIGEKTVTTSSNGTPKVWVLEVASDSKLVLAENVFDHAAYKVFDEMPNLTVVDPNEKLSSYNGSMPSIDYVPLILDSANGLQCKEIGVVTYHSFDPGGAYLSTRLNNYQAEPYVEHNVENVAEPYACNVFDEMPSPLSIGLYDKSVAASYFGSKADCITNLEVSDQTLLKKGTTMLLDKLLVRGSFENGEKHFGGECENFKPLDKLTVSTHHINVSFLSYAETTELGKCKGENPIILADDEVVFNFDPGGFGFVVEYESLLIWEDHSDTGESIHRVHDRCILRKGGFYVLSDRMQASATIFGSHNWDIIGCLLVLLAESFVPSCVSWHNTNIVTPITPSVTWYQVIQRLMCPLKAYGITAFSKGENSAGHMAVGSSIIQSNKGKSLWSNGMIMRTNFSVHLYLEKVYSTSSSMNYLAKLIAIMLRPSSTRTITVFPHFGQCKNVISLINNDLVFSFDLGATACFLITQTWMDRFHFLWRIHFDGDNLRNAAFVKLVLLGEHHLKHEHILPILRQIHLMSEGSSVYLCCWVYFDDAMTIFVPVIWKIFVWDPGQNIFFLCILEDKDDFEKVGKRIIPMNIVWVMMEVDGSIMGWCEMDVYVGYLPQMEMEHSRVGLFKNCLCVDLPLASSYYFKGSNRYVCILATKEVTFQDADHIALAVLASQLQMEPTDIWDPRHDTFYIRANHSLMFVLENFVWDPGHYMLTFFPSWSSLPL